ncbi:hypothetical protein EC844_12731 [Acinetobacter calcoaceticus]|uniref:Lipoprotein n=1 Tax=Acinetobacter calcoaceticus TaxID=471 RepID=A0A4R1XQA0_ACICA|nr:hypothetical protein EC844_12731 [Acinetobacter calcoaceticus]
MLRQVFNTVIVTGFIFFNSHAFANNEDLTSSLSDGQPTNAVNTTASTMSGVVEVDPAIEQVQARFLPIWGNEARAKGYDLPKTFGISYNYMNLKQDIVVDGIGFIMPKNPDTAKALVVTPGHTNQESESHMLKLDAWVFPFMNVYGLYGKTKGSSTTILEGVDFIGMPLPIQGMPFELEFEGQSFGAGVNFAAGYKKAFGTLDINYTRSDLDVLDGSIKALMITPRIGYNLELPELIEGQGNSKLQLWTGAMYQDVTQHFRGNVNDLNLPPMLKMLLSALDDPGMKFDVNQHLAHKWNPLVGARYEVTPNFNLTTEVGFNNRKSYLISGEFRF